MYITYSSQNSPSIPELVAMAAKVEHLSSTSHLSTIAAKNSVVIIDFHATWCGPCKIIAPVFESLAARHAAPNSVAFAKCDVDSCQDVASQYGVRAMPTFVILRNRSEVDRIQGADRSALTAAVERHVKLAKPAAGFATSGKGYKLGSGSDSGGSSSAAKSGAAAGRTYLRNGQVTSGPPFTAVIQQFFRAVVAFFGLYVFSFFSIDPIEAAANSPFANTRDGETRRGGSIWGDWSSNSGPGGRPGGNRLGTTRGVGVTHHKPAAGLGVCGT